MRSSLFLFNVKYLIVMEFLESKFLYLGLMIFSLSYPLAQSFESRIALYKQWKALFVATTVMMLLFIPWDIWFTHLGVWWFRDDYISGVKFLLLPIEEWLFFIIVPYACVFIYEVLNYFIKKDILKSISRPFFFVLGFALLILSILYVPKYYTSITFSLTGLSCLIIAFLNPIWIGRFLLAYLVSWLPFLLINGALTGNFTLNPVVNYNESEIIGLRITSIPIEDSIYNLFMLMLVVWVYESMKSRKNNDL